MLPAIDADQPDAASAIVALDSLVSAAATPASAAAGGACLSFLHHAVRSQSVPLVTLILGWAEAEGAEFAADAPGPQGITPLHLAAIIPDGGAMADLLTGKP